MRLFICGVSLSMMILLTSCTCKYREQLSYYQSTIGNKCMYYLDKDKEIDKDKKDLYYTINKNTTEMLSKQ